jgi:hypothetical protein
MYVHSIFNSFGISRPVQYALLFARQSVLYIVKKRLAAFSGIVFVRDGHGGGWSRKINARYLHTLMVYL